MPTCPALIAARGPPFQSCSNSCHVPALPSHEGNEARLHVEHAKDMVRTGTDRGAGAKGGPQSYSESTCPASFCPCGSQPKKTALQPQWAWQGELCFASCGTWARCLEAQHQLLGSIRCSWGPLTLQLCPQRPYVGCIHYKASSKQLFLPPSSQHSPQNVHSPGGYCLPSSPAWCHS